jgi:hypothetical protein
MQTQAWTASRSSECLRKKETKKHHMKKTILILGLVVPWTAFAQSSEYDPYYGYYGGYRFRTHNDVDDGGAEWDPYAGTNGGWHVRARNGRELGTWEYDPYAGTNSGWHYHPESGE